MSLTELRRRADELRRRQHDLLRANAASALKVAQAKRRIADGFYDQPEVIDTAAWKLLPIVAPPRRLPEEIAEQMRAEWDRANCGDRWE